MVCTRILRWPGGDLVTNAQTATEGRLCVRVLTPMREVIPGYDYAACGDLSGDSTDHRVLWGDRSMATLAGRELRIEFFLETGPKAVEHQSTPFTCKLTLASRAEITRSR